MGGFPAARIADQTAHGGLITMGCPTVLIGNMPAARIGDMHTCPLVTALVPHVGGPLVLGSFTVLVGGMPQSRETDTLICVGPPDMVAVGCPTVIVGMAGAGGLLGMLKGLALAGLSVLKRLVGGGYPRAVAQPDGGYVTEYNSAIAIEGSPEYQAKVIADLNRIAKTPTGRELLHSIAESGKKVTIKAPDDPNAGNSCGSYDNPNGRFSNPDGTPGAGSNSTVEFNPDCTKIGDESWETRPPGVGLAHELIHADQAAHGTMTPGTTNNDAKPDPADPTKTEQANTREVEAVGIPPNDNRDYTENKIRNEWDPKQPQRQWY